jgi:hypothetical protein
MCQMSVSQMSVSQMSVIQMSVIQMSDSEMSQPNNVCYTMFVIEMSVGQSYI